MKYLGKLMMFGAELRLVMFDLDGTLIDTLPGISHALDLAMEDLDFNAPGIEQSRLWVGNGSIKLVERAVCHALEVEASQLVNDSLIERAVHQVQQRFFEHYDHTCELPCPVYDGVEQALDYLLANQVILACVTNKPRQFSSRVLEAVGIAGYFAEIVSGDSLDERKPHPAPLLYVMKKFDVPAEKSMMVGDSFTDIRAARAAGVSVVAVDYGYNYGEAIPHPRSGHANAPDGLVSNLSACLPA